MHCLLRGKFECAFHLQQTFKTSHIWYLLLSLFVRPSCTSKSQTTCDIFGEPAICESRLLGLTGDS